MKNKKLSLLLLMFAAVFAAGAQSLNVNVGNVTYSFPAIQTGIMEYSNEGKSITIQGKTFGLTSDIEMNVVQSVMEENLVVVEYKDTKATVTIAGNIAQYVTATVSGAHVTLYQSEGVNDITGEINYVLNGTSNDGSFTLNGQYKATIELQNLTLTNPSGAAIDIENGKRIEISSKSGTINTLIDGSGGQKAALYCKGHLELKGKGTLNVKGNAGHAIAAKEYIAMKNCTVNVTGAIKDGINCAQYFLLESGSLNISGVGDDGIQCDFKDSETKREAIDTGTIEIRGGTLNVEATGTAAKAFKADGDFVMTGGELTAKASGTGEWDGTQTKASSCVGINGNAVISGGTLNLTSTAGGGKGITCDGRFIFNDGSLTITTSGGVLAYSSGSLHQNYTGNTDNLNSKYKSSPKGIKADGTIDINGGEIFVKTSGNGGEGIESKAVLTVNGGSVKVRAKDDAINSSSHMYIKGGTIDAISTGNDGLDSNGNLYIEDGLVMAFGASAPECGLDANEEDGYTVYFTGGYILAAGGGNSVPTKSGSTQPYVSVSVAVSANATVTIGTSDATLYTFTLPSDLTGTTSGSNTGYGPGGWGGPGGMGGNSGSSLLISVPGLTSGTSYTVTSGTTSTTGTARITGSTSGPGGRF